MTIISLIDLYEYLCIEVKLRLRVRRMLNPIEQNNSDDIHGVGYKSSLTEIELTNVVITYCLLDGNHIAIKSRSLLFSFA